MWNYRFYKWRKINKLHYCLWWCSSSYFYWEKYMSSQVGLEPTTFRSPVRRSNHSAIRTQMAEHRLYFDVGHFQCGCIQMRVVINKYIVMNCLKNIINNIYVRASIHLLYNKPHCIINFTNLNDVLLSCSHHFPLLFISFWASYKILANDCMGSFKSYVSINYFI